MSQKVADGLVTINQIDRPYEIRGDEKVDQSMVQTFWHAFHTSRHASDREIDHRLEYLFWRIWSSDNLMNQVTVAYLDDLVSRILDSGPIASSARSGNTGLLSPDSTKATSSRAVPCSDSKSMPQNVLAGSATLHPILKKPKASTSAPPKTARLLIQQPGGDSITRNPSNPSTPNVVEPKESIAGRGPKRPLTPSRTRGGRRRPLIVSRRKPSQATTPKAAGTTKKQSAEHTVRQNADQDSEDRESETSYPMDEIFDDDDDMSSQPATPKSTERKTRDATWADHDHDQPFIDFPVTVTPAVASILTDGRNPTNPAIIITPAGLSMDTQDPILSQGIPTVSAKAKQTMNSQTEPQDNSLSETNSLKHDFHPNWPAQGTPVPGFKDAYRVPMPESMMDELLDIITDKTPLDGFLPAPAPPLHSFIHAWHNLPHPYYRFDYMIQHLKIADPQPSERPLVSKDFRKQWIRFMEENETLAQQTAEMDQEEAARESLAFIQQGRDMYESSDEDFDESEIISELKDRETGEPSRYYSDLDD
ncbi:hypothetical protein N7520_007121 [Penicillium odoratum]|uniref:uncharacterized protein n=1 Tax=Penicillium odoratum TaxID=1167516 RepID=UPI002547A064|nr:uncharacterized protein N7520_007121 [Penicillium odoratum]KAJ5759965.1 hypothetical protein N7520_007121 [Penicillium odoratum]